MSNRVKGKSSNGGGGGIKRVVATIGLPEHLRRPSPPPPLFDARFSQVLARGVSVWKHKDTAIAMLTPDACYNLVTMPFSELTPDNAGFLKIATSVVFSARDFATDEAKATAPSRALMMLTWDRSGVLYDRKPRQY